MKNVLSILVLVFGLTSFAHEGAHGPEQKMAPHGGILKDGKTLMGELIQDPSGVKIYLLNHKSEPFLVKNVTIDTKKIQLTDSKKKTVTFEVLQEESSLLIKFDKSKSYRFNLSLPLEFQKKQDLLSWQFEPQSN